MNKKSFMSTSGDMFLIPSDQYDEEVQRYIEAVETGDEDTMLLYEEGSTGWELDV